MFKMLPDLWWIRCYTHMRFYMTQMLWYSCVKWTYFVYLLIVFKSGDNRTGFMLNLKTPKEFCDRKRYFFWITCLSFAFLFVARCIKLWNCDSWMNQSCIAVPVEQPLGTKNRYLIRPHSTSFPCQVKYRAKIVSPYSCKIFNFTDW